MSFFCDPFDNIRTSSVGGRMKWFDLSIHKNACQKYEYDANLILTFLSCADRAATSRCLSIRLLLC